MLSEYITSLADVSFHIVAYLYSRFRYSGKNPMRFAVFWRISVRFCGFQTPLTPPSFSYERSQKEVMLLDIQGCGSCLFDPEIASKQLDPKNMLFCTGNLSHNAIQNFTASHKCNDYCNLLKLTPFE